MTLLLRRRLLALTMVVLLAAPLQLAAAQATSGPPGLSVVGIHPAEDRLTLEVRSHRDLRNVSIQLLSGGAIVGLPEWRITSWPEGIISSWTYDLLREVDTVSVLYRYEANGTYQERTESVHIPRDAPASPAGGAARLVVTEGAIERTSVRIGISNFGDAAAVDIIISLEDAQQRRIATPYSRRIAEIPAGESRAAGFELPAPTESVVVVLATANATTSTSVLLKREDAPAGEAREEHNVTLSTDLPFREVDLGRSVDYGVQVRNDGPPTLVQLALDALPAGYSARFFVGGSAVPSLYLDRNQTRQVTLSVTVPNDADEVDRTVDFTTEARVNGTTVGALAMGLAVRGVGQLELRTTGEEAVVPAGGDARFSVVVRNSGSAPLFNIELDSRRPYGWTVRPEPRMIDRLDPGQSSTITVEVRAPDVIGGGRYSLDVAAAAGDRVSPYSTLAVNVQDPEGDGGWLWVVFLLAIAGILALGAWWKWRG